MITAQQLSVIVCHNEPGQQEFVRGCLAADGFSVTVVDSGEHAVNLIRRQPVDLAMVDMNLPSKGGIEVCWQIRAHSPRTGIIMSTANSEDDVRALDAGADDCVTPPFRGGELVARFRAILRRVGVSSTRRPARIEAGGLRLDTERRSLWRGNEEISLSTKEFGLLAVLMKNEGVPVAREELLRAVWGPRSGDLQSLRTYIRRLRRKLECEPDAKQYIFTEHWTGYRFSNPSHAASGNPRGDRIRYQLPPHNRAKLSALRVDQVRKAVQSNEVSFPHPVPTFDRHDRADLQWKLVLLYFVRCWSCEDIAARYGLADQRVRQILKTWTRRAVETGYLEFIPPPMAAAPAALPVQPAQLPSWSAIDLPWLPAVDGLPAEIG